MGQDSAQNRTETFHLGHSRLSPNQAFIGVRGRAPSTPHCSNTRCERAVVDKHNYGGDYYKASLPTMKMQAMEDQKTATQKHRNKVGRFPRRNVGQPC